MHRAETVPCHAHLNTAHKMDTTFFLKPMVLKNFALMKFFLIWPLWGTLCSAHSRIQLLSGLNFQQLMLCRALGLVSLKTADWPKQLGACRVCSLLVSVVRTSDARTWSEPRTLELGPNLRKNA